MVVEAEAKANATPTPMAENGAAPRREASRREAWQHKAIGDSTPEQPTQGLAPGLEGVPSNGFLGYPHNYMYHGAVVQARYHSWECLHHKCKCTEATCAWWDVQILWHGGTQGIRVQWVNLSSGTPVAERWDECFVGIELFRPKDKDDESQNSVSKNLDGALRLAQANKVLAKEVLAASSTPRNGAATTTAVPATNTALPSPNNSNASVSAQTHLVTTTSLEAIDDNTSVDYEYVAAAEVTTKVTAEVTAKVTAKVTGETARRKRSR